MWPKQHQVLQLQSWNLLCMTCEIVNTLAGAPVDGTFTGAFVVGTFIGALLNGAVTGASVKIVPGKYSWMEML